MDTRTAEQNLQALQTELQALPEQIRKSVEAMKSGEVRRLRTRQTEIEDELLAAEMAVIDAQLADLPSAQELARRGRQAAAQLQQAEQEHKAAVEKLVAARTVANADLVVSLSTQQARDRLMRAKAELELRFSAASGEQVFVDMAGRRVLTPGTYKEADDTHSPKTKVSPFAGHSEIGRRQPAASKNR